MTPRQTSQRGFTLLEVLLAAVLIGSVFVAVLSVMSQSLRNIERMTPHETALRHAREVMTEELVREQLAPEQSRGRWDDGFRWEVEILPYEAVTTGGPAAALPQLAVSKPDSPAPAAGTFGLFKIRVVIAWGEDSRRRTYAVETTQWAKWLVPKPS